MFEENLIKIIASNLASKGRVVSVENGSIFEAINTLPDREKRISEVAELIGNNVKADLLLLKSKLLPEMEKFNTLVNDKLKEYKPVKRADKYYIKELSIPNIIKELKDQNQIGNGQKVDELPISVVSIDLLENWKEYLQHTNQAININMAQILNTYTDENLKSLWNKVFSNVSKSNEILNGYLYSTIENIEELLIIWLLTTNLLKNTPSNLKVSDDTFYSVMTTLKNSIAGRLNYVYEQYNEDTTYGKVIISVRNTDRYLKDGYVINVNKDAYDDFINQGGDSEAILGMVAGKYDFTLEKSLVKNILLESEKYKDAWKRFATTSDTLDKLDEPNRYKLIYSIALKELLEKIPEDLKDVIKIDAVKADELFNKLLNEKPGYELVEIDEIGLQLFQYILVPDTNFGIYVTNMLTYKKMNPELTTPQTASLASIDLILTYLLNQVSISEFKN